MVPEYITYNWLTKLIILKGTFNEFSYGHVLLFYNDDINIFNLKYNTDIDLAYLIENLYVIIKPRVKRRNLEIIEDLKRYLLEE